MSVNAKLKERGISLPAVAQPAANYIPWTIQDRWIIIAGQLPLKEGKTHFIGKLGQDLTIEQGQEAAQLCALNMVAALAAATNNDLDSIERIIQLKGYVNCVPDFIEIPQVINGASDFIVDLFGEAGRHARIAIGAHSLPRGVAVEIEGVAYLKG